jgi:putative salt-induced outer membrane protein
MKRIALGLAVLAASGVAVAEEKESRWSGESSLGYVWTNGNTKSETLFAKQKLVYDANPWVNTFVAEATNTSNSEKNAAGKNEKRRVAERYFVSDQVDFFVAKHTYLFLRASGEKDQFNGFDFRASWVLGAGHNFIDTETVKLKGEAGAGQAVDMIEENLPAIEKQRRSDGMGYLAEEFTWKFSPNAELGQALRSEYTRFNTFSRFDAYVKANLVGNLSMKVAYTLRFNNKVPKGNYRRDEEASVSLNYSF